MSKETIYLYGYGRRRHIADPAFNGLHGQRRTYCGNRAYTETARERIVAYWEPHQARVDQRMSKMRSFPVCASCENSAAKRNA